MICHFEVIEPLKNYLKGIKYSFCLNFKTANTLLNKDKIEAISITSYSVINESVLSLFPKLKFIVTRSVGLDHIDKAACRKFGISVKNIPDYGSYNIAEHIMALLLAGARNIIKANSQTHRGKFSYKDFIGVGLKGKTLGVIGTGKIGLAFIKIAKSFDLNIIAYDIFKNDKASKELGFKYYPLSHVVCSSDIISINIPLLADTKHLISTKEINNMKDNLILINTSRGAIINTSALIKNIKKFKAVCLDVLEDEDKFSSNNPLLKFDNVIITPHIGFFTDDSIRRIGEETMKIIKNYQSFNKPRINPERSRMDRFS